MIEYDRLVRKGACEIGHVGNADVIAPGVERQAEIGELGKALAKLAVEIKACRRGPPGCRAGRIVGAGHADAANPVPAGAALRFQQRFHRRTKREIGMTDDAGGDPYRAIAPARAHRRYAIGELGLADRREILGDAGAEKSAGSRVRPC